MAVKVRVRNFQSIKDATLVIDGLTAITGPNNTGKSAFLRAIRGAFQNAKGHRFVRHGASHCQVDIEFADGRTLTWKKGPKVKPTYIIDGGKPIHPGAGVPEEVRDMGVAPIGAGGRDIWPQFAEQLTGQVFLLDEPGSVLAEAVANVDRVGRLNRSMKASEKDKRAVSSKLKVRLEDRTMLEDELAAFEGLDAIEREADVLEEAAGKTQKMANAIQGIQALREAFQNAKHIVGLLQGIEAVEVPATGDAEDLLVQWEDTRRLRRALQKTKAMVTRYEGVEGIDLGDLSEGAVERIGAAISNVTEWQRKLTKLKEAIDQMEAQAANKAGELQAAKAEIAELLGDLGECPVCGTVCHTPGHKE